MRGFCRYNCIQLAVSNISNILNVHGLSESRTKGLREGKNHFLDWMKRSGGMESKDCLIESNPFLNDCFLLKGVGIRD